MGEPTSLAVNNWVASPGLHRGVSNDDYHSDRTAVSSTSLKKILRSPAHFRAAQSQPAVETKAQGFGSAVHALLLEPEKYSEAYYVQPSELRTTPEPPLLGRTLVSMAQHLEMMAMCESAKRHGAVRNMLGSGEAEVTVCWIDAETGVFLKVRPDWLQLGQCIWDVKTAEDGSSRGFSRACANYDYHLSCAMYRVGIYELTGEWLPFRFVVLEKGGPLATAVYEADPSFIRRGEKDFRAAVRKLAECRASNVWHGYQQDEIELIALPPWK